MLLTGVSAVLLAGAPPACVAGGHPPLPLIVTSEPAPAAADTRSIPGAAAAGAVAAPVGHAATSQDALDGVRRAGSWGLRSSVRSVR